MQKIAGLASLVTLAAAHGFIQSPPPRQPGDAYKAACGDQPYYQQSSDINGNVQGIFQVVGDDAADDCRLWLCKGFLLEDNPNLVQSYSLGETIDFEINIAAPHVGYANVSVVKTSTDTIIGSPLIEFQNYADNAGIDPNNTAFSVTLPDNLDGDCTSAGDCVLQWFWDAPDIDQTYESCVDFTVGGNGSEGDLGNDDVSAPSPSIPATSTSNATSAPTAATSAVASNDAAPTASEVPSSPLPSVDPEKDEDEDASQGNQGEISSSVLPETFTLDTFIEWLIETTGTTTKDRRHAREVQI